MGYWTIFGIYAVAAYPKLYKRVFGKRVPLEQAVADILQEYGIKTKADLDNQTDKEAAEFYENLKSGILEEYDLTINKLQPVINKLLK